VVANQPLQLQATGGTTYAWTPAIGMNNPSIANPVVVIGNTPDSIIYKVRVGVPEGCFAEDQLQVKVFKTNPDILIPTAFTPNYDGRNDVFKPVAVGIKAMEYFRVYNRWGQLLYSTNSVGSGWDGTFQGKEQATGTYVFMAKAIDYLGNEINRKGTVLLIR
jgi:gliding motility-associated-like protein